MTKRIQLKGPLIPNDYQEMYDFYNWEGTSAKKISDELPKDIAILLSKSIQMADWLRWVVKFTLLYEATKATLQQK